MSKEPNVAKAAKKPPAPAKPAAGLESTKAQVQGKVVRKDRPAEGTTQVDSVDTSEIKKPKPAARASSTKGKVIRKDAPTDRTVAFDAPADDISEEAAAAFLTQAFGDVEEPAAPADAPVGGATQAFSSDTIATDAPTPASQDSPPGSATQAFSGDTLGTDMPKLAKDSLPATSKTQAFTGNTIDTEKPAKPAQARKPAANPGAEKGAAMATMLADKYKLLKKLGQGGMGSVYKAHEVERDRIVAIKVLAKELANKEAYVERFKREGRVMDKVEHQNILRLLDMGTDKKMGLHYLVMEFVEGGSVENWLKKLGKFSIGDALHIVTKVAEGLQHAHDKSLIHRDIKPDNILLTKDGVVKVADLGLAKDTEEDTSLTKTGAGAGTPIYMAPEQARDVKHVDARVDVYALGVMLYVFLTGQAPFQGNTLVELISAKDKGKFDPMRKHNSEVPGKLDLIVDKMIAKDPKNRYASCQDVLNDLEPLGLTNDSLSFIETDAPKAEPTMLPGLKAAKTSGPAKVVAKTSVGGSGKAPAAKTSGPSAPAAKTRVPSAPASKTAISDEDEDTVETDVWYWSLVTGSGKSVTKKLNTEQVRTLIKAGHMDAKAQLSKTETGSYRAAATFPEFQAIFKSLKTATKANIKGAKYRDKYKEIEEEDARRRKWGWLSRSFKSFGGILFGLLWIAIILGLVAGGLYFGYTYMNP